MDESFLSLTDEELEKAGIKALGMRMELLALVERTNFQSERLVKKLFEASNDQLKECFHVLEEKGSMKEYLKSFAEEKFFKDHTFLHAHRLGKTLLPKPPLNSESCFLLITTLSCWLVCLGVANHMLYI